MSLAVGQTLPLIMAMTEERLLTLGAHKMLSRKTTVRRKAEKENKRTDNSYSVKGSTK